MTQNTAQYDVCAVGNAIVDVLSPCDAAFLTAQDLAPNSMQLVDADRSAALYDAMAPGVARTSQRRCAVPSGLSGATTSQRP